MNAYIIPENNYVFKLKFHAVEFAFDLHYIIQLYYSAVDIVKRT